MVKYTGRGLVVKRPGVLSKVQMLTLVLGVGVFSLLPIVRVRFPHPPPAAGHHQETSIPCFQCCANKSRSARRRGLEPCLSFTWTSAGNSVMNLTTRPKNNSVESHQVEGTVRRFPMEPFLETLWCLLVPISALLESLFFAIHCY